MPNKKYWSQVQDILEFTQVLTGDNSEELKQSLEEVKEYKNNASNAPMEEITLAGLAKEFVEVFAETCENYKKAETQAERAVIIDEVKEASNDIFCTIQEEMSEAFSYIGSRF